MSNQLEHIASDPGVFLTGVLVLGGMAQWIAWRFRFPSILLLLAFGFVARTLTGIDPATVLGEQLLFSLVSLFVAVVLFEGGLSLKLVEVRESKAIVAKLVTVGVLVTWVLATIAGCLLLEMDWRVAALVGAVLTVTGPTVVGPLLRHIRPSRNVASITKWEGIVVDPIGALLAVLVFEALFSLDSHGAQVGGFASVATTLLKTVLAGGAVACVSAYALIQLLKRYLIPDYLHNFVFLVVAIASFTASNLIQHESGLFTVTLLGILLANQSAFPVKHVLEFKESLRDLLISTLFIVLSARIEVSQVIDLGWGGVAFVALLIVVVRPLAVFASCVGSGLDWRQRTFLAFLAPRGIVAAAVSSVFAVDLMHFHGTSVVGSESIVPLTFLVIVGTVTTYGLFSPLLARLLGLAAPNPQGILFAGATPFAREIAQIVHDLGYQVLLVDTNYQSVSAARQSGLPAVCASVLSEYVDEEVDLGGLGRMLAVTSNDDLNRLASLEFAGDFGRANVYQLAPRRRAASERRQTSTAHLEGRYLFDGLDFEQLEEKFAAGATVKRTSITQEFSYEEYLNRYGESATVLFVVTAEKLLQIATTEAMEPKVGESVVSLLQPQVGPVDVATSVDASSVGGGDTDGSEIPSCV